ncbi:MAG: aminotransferase class V-fold PLP-dependent enzyme [Gammaproteobacteria bacterium]|nr:aminotransferase class V-fold PLP-dependent enzyme [Gammaproteobacteria bacterium]
MPAFEQETDLDGIASVLQDVALRMQDNYPYAHPLYAGQMLKPPHPVARLAYMLAMWVNPNNHALDGGRASSEMEKEAVAAIAAMYGWKDRHLGHLTSGGTMANLEALWIAGNLHAGKKVLASSQAHYTHSRISAVLKLPFESVACDQQGRLDITDLRTKLERGDVGTVVATLGTTGAGAVDPLPEILSLREEFEFRIHVDAAYGGYFLLADNLGSDSRASFDCIDRVDSIVVDPHKHGLQPYGCGCILFRDPAVGRIYDHDSPYTYFSSDELHLGEISLECSRAGASAVALWATQRLLPMTRDGEFAQGLSKCRAAALELHRRLRADDDQLTVFEPELDIVIWAPGGRRGSEISRRSSTVFDKAAEKNLHLALVKLPADLLRSYWPDVGFDEETVTCLRSCLMKPEHEGWLDEIWRILKDIS